MKTFQMSVKCELGPAVQWSCGDICDCKYVGKLVLANGQHVIGRDSHGMNGTVLVAHACTRELEFVSYAALKPYPESPIEEPSAYENRSGI